MGNKAIVASTTMTAAHGVVGIGFLPNRNVTIRITRTGGDISDYLAYTGSLSNPGPLSGPESC
jgi:hypothetical protein